MIEVKIKNMVGGSFAVPVLKIKRAIDEIVEFGGKKSSKVNTFEFSEEDFTVYIKNSFYRDVIEVYFDGQLIKEI